MFAHLLNKELRAFVHSPRFVGTFIVGVCLILLSVYIGIREYQAAVDHARASQQLSDQRMREGNSWMRLSARTYRTPEPMMIFVSGLTFDIGQWSDITTQSGVRLQHSSYSDDPIFAVFRFIDFAFIVTIVMSLFALLYTYDAVSGEREDGTLKLVFSNPVPRAQYLLAKAAGAWIGLTSALAVPAALGILLVMLFGVPFGPADWLKLALLMTFSALLSGCFVMIGLLISTLTRHSSVSFLVGLMSWVVLSLILPRTGAAIAGQLVPVPSVAEIQGQREAYAQDRWNKFMKEGSERWGRVPATDEMTDEALQAQMQMEDSLRRQVDRDINTYEAGLFSDLRRKKARQESMALSLARVSPATAYHLAAMSLAGTDIALKTRYEDAMNAYRDQFTAYVEKKEAENPGQGAVRIAMDSEKGMNIQASRDAGALDISGIPTFSRERRDMSSILPSLITNFGLLAVMLLACLAGSAIAFARYDVR